MFSSSRKDILSIKLTSDLKNKATPIHENIKFGAINKDAYPLSGIHYQ